ncbi:glycoside hydrolase family 97 protein [Opitutus terrae]|nr:glycoside hydrolase family 97 protein [Opitutus terrae]
MIPLRVVRWFGCLVALSVGGWCAVPSLPVLQSPDGRIAVQIRAGGQLAYDVLVDETVVVRDATLALQVEQTTLGRPAELRTVTPRQHDATVQPVVRQKAATLRDRYHELRLEFAGNYAVVFRAYDEGVAYRWETQLAQSEVKVFAEEAAFNFADNQTVWYPEEESFFSHNERIFLPRTLGDLAAKNLASLPAVVEAGQTRIAILESDVEDYPGLWLRGTSGSGLTATFPPYPLKEELTGDRDVRVTAAADYLAVTRGSRTYPWRILAVAHRDGELLTNPLVYLLAAPSRVADTSWIKPGKVAWDWWNANNVFGVDFKSGVNTATYKYYIDFAAANGLDYVVLDEGWYKLGNVLDVVPEIDVPELVAYGRQKNVSIVLWVVWKTLEDQLQPALDQFAQWGVRGIKVDFMQRDDQKVMSHYHRVSAEAAKRRLLVDFHGAIRPALLTRTYPNLITTEGVRGNEWNKWSTHITPEHTATLPFTRMMMGPMDFTPGATLNANRTGFAANFARPSSQGTRCHQLALYVVFESPLQMLCDSPSHYLREPDMMEFLRSVPTEWDETRVLDARISDYVVVARRRGADWYLGAITDWNTRELELDLSFLSEGRFTLDEYRDGVNADRFAQDYKRSQVPVNRETKLKLRLAEGGGYAARISAE